MAIEAADRSLTLEKLAPEKQEGHFITFFHSGNA